MRHAFTFYGSMSDQEFMSGISMLVEAGYKMTVSVVPDTAKKRAAEPPKVTLTHSQESLGAAKKPTAKSRTRGRRHYDSKGRTGYQVFVDHMKAVKATTYRDLVKAFVSMGYAKSSVYTYIGTAASAGSIGCDRGTGKVWFNAEPIKE